MKTLGEMFPAWTEALGWTLLNSTWQALLIFSLVMLIMRWIPSRLSQVRYFIACSGMALVLVMSIVTFIYHLDFQPSATSEMVSHHISSITSDAMQNIRENFAMGVQSAIASHMHLIVLCWIAGAFLFSLRIVSGWWYISRLKSEATVLDDQWSAQLKALAQQLRIDRVVKLAESSRIDVPMVLGCLRPVILVPVGMLSGLSMQQVESIFLHELAHVRRHDYLINIIQSFVETIFFFNPFVWIISGIIRREREYCCDDEVISTNRSALTYARALAQLEEIRLAKPVFAITLGKNKNQLLNRIKRIMEKSAKNYSSREKILPAALVVIGLICASWLTINASGYAQNEILQDNSVAGDTIDRKKQKSATYSRKTITTYDANGKPHQEIVENFEGDEELKPLIDMNLAFDFDIPQSPDSISPVDVMPAIPPMPDFDILLSPSFNLFDGDSIPRRLRSEKEWEEFSEAFSNRFREQFGDFYNEHGKEIEKMMKDFEEDFHSRFDETQLRELREQALAMADAHRIHADVIRDAQEHARHAAELAREQAEAFRHQHGAQLEEQLEHQRKHLSELDEHLKTMNANMKQFEKEIRELLLKDGYISKDEKVESLRWDDEGNMKVNDKAIKKSDQKKYRALHNKYFKDGGKFEYSE